MAMPLSPSQEFPGRTDLELVYFIKGFGHKTLQLSTQLAIKGRHERYWINGNDFLREFLPRHEEYIYSSI
jgi:hypothetical protein